MESNTSKICIACSKVADYNCSNCFSWYCSSKCQMGHWPLHKDKCESITKHNKMVTRESFTPPRGVFFEVMIQTLEKINENIYAAKVLPTSFILKESHQIEHAITLTLNILIAVDTAQTLKIGEKAWIQTIGSKSKEGFFHAIHMPKFLRIPFVPTNEKMEIELVQFFVGNQKALCRSLAKLSEREFALPTNIDIMETIKESPGEGSWVFAWYGNLWQRARLVGWSDESEIPHLVYLIDQGKMCFSKKLKTLPVSCQKALMRAFVIVFDKPYLGLTAEQALSLRFNKLSIIADKTDINTHTNQKTTPNLPCQLFKSDTKLGIVHAQTFSGLFESIDLNYWKEHIIDGSIVVINSYANLKSIAISPSWTRKYSNIIAAMIEQCPLRLSKIALETCDIFLAYNMEDEIYFRARCACERNDINYDVIEVIDIDTGKFYFIQCTQIRELNRFLRSLPVYLTHVELAALTTLTKISEDSKATELLNYCCDNAIEFMLKYQDKSLKVVELSYRSDSKKTLNAELLQLLNGDFDIEATNSIEKAQEIDFDTQPRKTLEFLKIQHSKNKCNNHLIKPVEIEDQNDNSKEFDIDKQLEKIQFQTAVENQFNNTEKITVSTKIENDLKPNFDNSFLKEIINHKNERFNMFGKLKRPQGIPFFKNSVDSNVNELNCKENSTDNQNLLTMKEFKNHFPEIDDYKKFKTPESKQNYKNYGEERKYIDMFGIIKRPYVRVFDENMKFSNELNKHNKTAEEIPETSKQNVEKPKENLNTTVTEVNTAHDSIVNTPDHERIISNTIAAESISVDSVESSTNVQAHFNKISEITKPQVRIVRTRKARSLLDILKSIEEPTVNYFDNKFAKSSTNESKNIDDDDDSFKSDQKIVINASTLRFPILKSPTKQINEKTTSSTCFMLADLKKIGLRESENVPLLILYARCLKENGILTAADNTENKGVHEMQQTMIKVNAYAKHMSKSFEGYNPAFNEICLAIFDDDEYWYRAVCLNEEISSNEFSLKFIDFGNSAIVSKKNIKPISEKLMFPSICNDCEIQGLTDEQLARLENINIENNIIECKVKFNEKSDIYDIYINNFDTIFNVT